MLVLFSHSPRQEKTQFQKSLFERMKIDRSVGNFTLVYNISIGENLDKS